MPNLIDLNNLTKIYPGDIVAVDDLSLKINEGEFVTLLGPSGCGKTTTLRMIAGFELPTRGRVLLNGEDVTSLPPYQRQVNTVFQDFALFPHMTVAQNIGYGLRVSGVPKSEIAGRVNEALTMVDLQEKANDRPALLSGGQRQRVALSRALVRKPKVLLLDEPLSSLDAKLREAMQVELKHLHKKLGITFILVTHDQTEAMVMSDRIVVMEHGRIAQSGTPTDLYDHPSSAYVASFLGNSNLISGRATSSDRSGATTVSFENGAIRGRCVGKLLRSGEKATVSIRPEKLLLLTEGGSAPQGFNVLTGTVRERLFQGNVMRIEVHINALPAPSFFVEVHLSSAILRTTMPKSGDLISIAADPDSVSIFPTTNY
jgi:putative spermidine/putrescine transport system ATP-binding protein/spermidine/putrescine transport system ATP-binding protein|tara:strand:+ start:3313 stop:4428 length:1116 start_codon:yes stop_codon:yes gene_type:complete